MLNIVKKITPINYQKGSGVGRIKYIVVHYFGGLSDAVGIVSWFHNPAAKSSAHYNVDEDVIIQCVEDGDIAWHCGTSGTYYHKECRNANSIGIEVRPYKIDKSTANSAEPRDWYFSQKVEDNLVELVHTLMEKYKIPIDNVVRHYDVTHKMCPRPWMGDDINIHYGQTGNTMWKKFKERVMDMFKSPVVDATAALVKAGVIDSPDYWNANYSKIQYLDQLITNLSKLSYKSSANQIDTLDAALDKLVAIGAINSPDYWRQNHSKLQYVDQFLIKCARRL